MAVKKFKPTTPGQRHKIIGVFKREEFLGVDAEGKNIVRKTTANAPEKSLTVGKRSTGGRNTSGELSTRYAAAATRENCVSSISRETTMTLRLS